MSISAAYATAAAYRAAIGKTDPADDAEILIDLTAVSRHLDAKLGRFFTRDAAPVNRVYIPAGAGPELWTDDLSAAPTGVAIDTTRNGTFATALLPRDYELLPLNALREPEPRPHNCIRLVPWGGRTIFPAGVRVRVTAQFGWPAVPPAVQQATVHITALLRLETPRATRRIPELGEAIEASPDAQRIIRQLTDQYKLVKYV
ncbi:MAG: hypothetical protein DDT20_01222 [Firmicutes bacterium]|nr:hypothetical protein [Bacillota bacterium]